MKSLVKKLTCLLLTLICCLCLAHPAQSQTPKNILFIHMEDMGCEISPYGDTTQATPHLQRLADEGITFERAHVTAASCAPSRGSIFSGLYPHQNGIWAFINTHGFHYRKGVPTFIKMLKDAGWRTGISYKTGVEPGNEVPFDYVGNYGKNPYVPKGEKSPHRVTNCIEHFQYFLENLPDGQSFYFQAQTSDTHHSWDKKDTIRGIESYRGFNPVDPETIRPLPHMGDITLTQRGKQHLADYYGAIQRVDHFVGEVLELLEAHGHADDTLVIFSADHGPSHISRGKTHAYEFGLRVPFIARWPGTKGGIQSQALVSFVDLMPTFLDVAGLEKPDHLAGHSLVSVLKGEKPEGNRKYLFSAYNAHTTGFGSFWPTRTITDGHYKLIHHLLGDAQTVRGQVPGASQQSTGRERIYNGLATHLDGVGGRAHLRAITPPTFELYDLRKDPGELHNLAGQVAYAEVQETLKAALHNWRTTCVKDPFVEQDVLKDFTDEYNAHVRQWQEAMDVDTPERGDNKARLQAEKWSLDKERWIDDWTGTDGYQQDPAL